MEEEKQTCNPYHTVNGYVPQLLDVQYNGIVCDCSRVIFYSEMCGCSMPHLELKSKPNE